MEQMKRNSKLILFFVTLLNIVLTFLALLEWNRNDNVTLASWTFGASTITILLLFISYRKLSDTDIYNWLLGGSFGIVFMGYWLFTNHSIGIVIALAASCTIILHSSLIFSYFATSLLCIYGCIVSIIRVTLGSKSSEKVIMEVVTIVIFAVVWLLISREQTRKAKENELLIQESQQRQDDQIQTLTHSSIVLNNLISNANNLSTNLKSKMKLSVKVIEQISQISVETEKSIQYQRELSNHICSTIKELQTISETIQSNINRSVETTEAGKKQVDRLINHSEPDVNVNNSVYQDNSIEKTSSCVSDAVENIQQENNNIQCINQRFEEIQNMLDITKASVETLDLKCKDLTTANSDLMDHLSKLSATRKELASQLESTVTMLKESERYSSKITDSLNKMKEAAELLVE